MKKKSTSQLRHQIASTRPAVAGLVSALFTIRSSIGLFVVMAGIFLALVSFGPATAGFAQNGTTRAKMARELAQALAIEPPPCVPGQEMFQDVPASSPFCPWIEELVRRGTTAGCAPNLYCPTASVTRAQMAVFLVKVLESHTIGDNNTTTGHQALENNTTGSSNTANGAQALFSNTTGSENTAAGWGALYSNTSGNFNTASGGYALGNNTTGMDNTAVGVTALLTNQTGSDNTAIGFQALLNKAAGSSNIAIGSTAGMTLLTGNHNIYIGHQGVVTESDTIRIGDSHTRTFITGIRDVTTGVDDAIPVVIASTDQLGTVSSSKRFKTEIKPMDKASEAVLALQPVTFHYKNHVKGRPQFGLIAEEVAEVNPDLVVRDENGEIYTVRYEAVNAMLLNEFLKAHRKIEEQQKQIDALATQLKEQAALIQKVSDKVEANKPMPQMVLNNE
jgi:hypothetical protein